jgi:hypothetical protein
VVTLVSVRSVVVLLVSSIAAAGVASARDRGADGRFSKRESSHFVLFQDVDIDRASGWRGSVQFERDLLETLELAHDRLDQLLGLRPPRPITVMVYDPAIFDAQFAGLFRFAAAGFYGGDIRIRGDTRVTVSLERVLHHELVHAAFDSTAPSFVLPGWVNEGVAEWFEARSLGKRRLSGRESAYLVNAAQHGSLLPLASLSAPSFAHLGPERAGMAYLQSYALIEHLVRRHGEADLRRFCMELVRSRDLTRSLARIFKTDLGKLERDFANGLP